MKVLATIALAAGVTAANAQPSVSLSVDIVQPGVYGRVVIGDAHRPPVIVNPSPVIVAPGRYARVRRPIYLYVPPAHQHDWARWCVRYGACDQPVYFVQDRWVRERYAERHPHYRPDRRPPAYGRRDRDHDGVPNRRDAHPGDPRRR